jgi:hypothetical protein
MVEYEGKKELLLTQLYILTGISRERLRMIDPVLISCRTSCAKKELSRELKFELSSMELLQQTIKSKQKEVDDPKVQLMASAYYIGFTENQNL